eukprot:g4461.t1
MYYYCGADGSVFGPYTFSQIGCWVADGSLPGATTYVQHVDAEQGEEWVSYDEACAGVGPEAAASYYDDNSAIAAQAEMAEQEGGGEGEHVAGAGPVGGFNEALRKNQWADSQWHYLDDAGAIQGPYNTETIGEWFKAGALGLTRYVSIDGADWVKLAESAPFLALWSNNVEADALSGTGTNEHGGTRAVESEASLDDNATSTAAPKKRRQSILLAAKRCHERRASLVGTSAPAKEQSELAKKLTSQRSMLRKTVTAGGRPAALRGGRPSGRRVHQRQKSTHMSHLLKGLEMRRTIITRGKKRRSSIVKSSLPVFRMADGSDVPEAQASAVRNSKHRRHVSEFSEDDEDSDDDWLSD